MRRTRLGTLLIGLNAGLVLLAVIAVAAAALGLIERFADEQGIARVNLAGAAAQEAVERSVRDVRTSAHLLSERPTVKRLVEGGDAAGLAAFLDRFRQTSSLSGVAIFSHGTMVAASGAPVPWGQVRTSAIARLPDGALLLGAASPLASTPDATAAAALVLDPAFARQIAGQVGLPVAILDPERALADAEDPRMPLRAEVLATGKPGSGRLKAAGLYVSVRPLRAPAGEVAALVETELPRDAVGLLARPAGARAAAALAAGGGARHPLGVPDQPAADPPRPGAHRLGGADRPRRPLDSHPARSRRRARHPRRHHGGDAPPPAPAHLRAAPPAGRGGGDPHRHRRRGVQRRPRPPHPVSQSAGGGAARRDNPKRRSAASAATCSIRAARTAPGRATRAARSSTPASAAAPPPPSISCGRTAPAGRW